MHYRHISNLGGFVIDMIDEATGHICHLKTLSYCGKLLDRHC